MLSISQQRLDASVGELFANLTERLARRSLRDGLFRNKRDGRVHTREPEHVRKQARDGYSEVVHTHATVAGCGRVQDGALKVRVDFLVELAFVLDLGCNRLVCVQ